MWTVHYRLIPIAAVCLLTAAATASAAGNTQFPAPTVLQETAEPAPTLQWKFRSGDQFTLDLKSTRNSTLMVAENPDTKNTSFEIRTSLSLQVLDVQDDVARLELQYQSISISIEDGARAAASTDPQEPQLGKGAPAKMAKAMIESLRPLLNVPVILEVNPTGKIEKLEIEESFVEQILAAPNTMALRENLSREGVEKTLGSLLLTFPQQGSNQWTQESTVQVGQTPLTRITQYSVVDASQSDNVKIQFQSNVKFPEEQLAAPETPEQLNDTTLQGRPGPFNFDPVSAKWPRIARQEASGNIRFDQEAGLMISSDSREILVTEKAQSNFIIRTTIDTQSQATMTKVQ